MTRYSGSDQSCSGFRLMSSIDSGAAEKVDDIHRNQWTICFGFSGRHAPDLVDDMLRIMQKPKGRDFFDISYLSSRTKPDMGFIQQKLEVKTAEDLRMKISSEIAKFDFLDLADDVAPFLLNENDIKRVEKFREFWEQVELE